MQGAVPPVHSKTSIGWNSKEAQQHAPSHDKAALQGRQAPLSAAQLTPHIGTHSTFAAASIAALLKAFPHYATLY